MAKYIARVFLRGYKPGQVVPESIGEANEGRFASDGGKKIPVVEKVEDPKTKTEQNKKRGKK